MRLERPEKVRTAQIKGDHRALSVMGKKGGEHAAINRDLKKAKEEEWLREAAIEQAKLLSLSPEGDVLPPDPTIIENLK